MASRGRRGVSAIVLGSETLKVLTHSTIPVLVYRAARAGLSSLQWPTPSPSRRAPALRDLGELTPDQGASAKGAQREACE